MNNKISIIVPVFNNISFISDIVNELIHQKRTVPSAEILFIDNMSVDGTYEKLVSFGDSVKVFRETKKGSYSARNKGVNVSIGDILVFTDSDCKFDKHWLLNIQHKFELDASVYAVQGDSKGHDSNIIAKGVQLYYEDVFYSEILNKDGYCNRIDTRNCAIKREVFNEIGLFNDRFSFWGDEEFGKRIVENGYDIHFLKEMKIYHKNIDNLTQLINKKKREGYIVYSQMISSGRNYVTRYFPKMLYVFLKYKLADLLIQLEHHRKLLDDLVNKLNESLPSSGEGNIKNLIREIIENSYTVGLIEAKIEEAKNVFVQS